MKLQIHTIGDQNGYVLTVYESETRYINVLLSFEADVTQFHRKSNNANDRLEIKRYLCRIFPKHLLKHDTSRLVLDIHLILLSETDPAFISGLPLLFPFLPAHTQSVDGTTVMGTAPVVRMVTLGLYDQYASYCQMFCQNPATDYVDHRAGTLDTIDAVLGRAQSTAYREPAAVTANGITLTFEASCAGGAIGRPLWSVTLPNRERLVLISGLAAASDGTAPVADIQSPSLQGAAHVWVDPRVMAVDPAAVALEAAMKDVPGAPKLLTEKKRLDLSVANILDKIEATARSQHDTLIPVESPAAAIDLLRRLDAAWRDVTLRCQPLRPALVFLSPVASTVIEAARAAMEFLAPASFVALHRTWDNPLTMPAVTPCHTMAELDRLPRPRVVVATSTPGLTAGLALSMFRSSVAGMARALLVAGDTPPDCSILSHTIAARADTDAQGQPVEPAPLTLRFTGYKRVIGDRAGDTAGAGALDAIVDDRKRMVAQPLPDFKPTVTPTLTPIPFITTESSAEYKPAILTPVTVKRSELVKEKEISDTALAQRSEALPSAGDLPLALRDGVSGMVPSVRRPAKAAALSNHARVMGADRDIFGIKDDLSGLARAEDLEDEDVDMTTAAAEHDTADTHAVAEQVVLPVTCTVARRPLTLRADPRSVARVVTSIIRPSGTVLLAAPPPVQMGQTPIVTLAEGRGVIDLTVPPAAVPVRINPDTFAGIQSSAVGGVKVGRLSASFAGATRGEPVPTISGTPAAYPLDQLRLAVANFGGISKLLSESLAGVAVKRQIIEGRDVIVVARGEEVVRVRYSSAASVFDVSGALGELYHEVRSVMVDKAVVAV